MTNFKTRLTTGIVTFAILASSFTPVAAFAANTNVTISDNGAGSTNNVTVKNKNKVKVRQTNRTAVVNLVGVFQNTGGNSANDNTGSGNVTVDSGSATSNVTSNTTTGGNDATVNPCGCPNPTPTVNVTGNGADSNNDVTIKSKSKFKVTQTNETLVINGVLVAQNTGLNHANDNTGDGTVSVDSGNAGSTVTNDVTTGGNVLNP